MKSKNKHSIQYTKFNLTKNTYALMLGIRHQPYVTKVHRPMSKSLNTYPNLLYAFYPQAFATNLVIF